MAYRPIFIFDNGEHVGNGEVYATRQEALTSAAARFLVWTMPKDYTAEHIDAPVNYKWENGARVNIAASALYEKASAILGKAKS